MEMKIVSSNVFSNGQHLSMQAWKYSRSEDDNVEADVLALDLTVNEMPGVVVEVTSTVLERDIITTPRRHSIWARSSRVDDIREFECPEFLNDMYPNFSSYQDRIREKIRQAYQDKRQDELRNKLPILSKCKYTMHVSQRNAAKYLNTFIKLSKMSTLASMLFDSAILEFTRILQDYFKADVCRIKEDGKSWPIHRIHNQNVKSETGRIGDFITVYGYIPFYLRAQLVRHRELTIADQLIDFIESDKLPYYTFNTHMRVQVSGHVEDWRNIVTKRSCWIAHYDLWSDIINQVESYANFGSSALPCSDGKCPYVEEVRHCRTGVYPGAPCPIGIEMDDGKTSKENIQKIIKQHADQNRPMFWLNHVNNLKVVE